MKDAMKWLIALSGVYDLIVGLGLIAATLNGGGSQPATWTLSMMSGGFLLFCGAVLIWGAQDVPERGSAIFWQGLLRLFAVAVIFHAIARGYIPAETADASRIAAYIDGFAAASYAVALFAVWKLSPWRVLLGRRSAGQ